MAVVVHARDVDPARLALMKTTLANDLVALAGNVSGGQDIVYRDLRPTDLNNGTIIGQLDNPTLTADTYATDVYSAWTRLGPQQAVAIFGFADLSASPKIDEVTFAAGPLTLAICVLDQIYASTTDMRGYFFPPIVWTPNEHVTVSLLSHAGATIHTDAFQWLGIIAEPVLTVAKPRPLMPGGPQAEGRVPGAI